MPESSSLLLTVPEEITGPKTLFLTGNEYLALPQISIDGSVASLNVLHMGCRGLLEFSGRTGRPLLQPFLVVNGVFSPLNRRISWSYAANWLPRFVSSGPGWRLEGEIFAPPGLRGGCCLLTLTNTSRSRIKAALGWRGSWTGFYYTIFSRRRMEITKRIRFDRWTDSLLLEAGGATPLAALALALQPRASWSLHSREAAYASAVTRHLEPGQSHTLALYLAVNLEADGAGTTAMDLKRRGALRLREETVSWLQRRRLCLDDLSLTRLLNRNLFFNYFFALGRALDTDELVAVTSRSPRYYVSAAFWSRDALLWSFPGILLIDAPIAREMLLAVFRRHARKAGEHAHYINGTVLYPGFELDQLAAFFLALQKYETATGDLSLTGEEVIGRGLRMMAAEAAGHQDEETKLYRTFLDPSDDPVKYPFLIYSNALLQRAFDYLANLQEQRRWHHAENFRHKADELRQAVYRHGVVDGLHGSMFAWAVDGAGNYQLYDNPPGSLQLLAHYGFCTPHDPVFRRTLDWIRSPYNPYYPAQGPFCEPGCLHSPKPWPLSAANGLLAGEAACADFLRRAPLDNGYCCETVHPASGIAATGAAFASAAGFLAYALWASAAAGTIA